MLSACIRDVFWLACGAALCSQCAGQAVDAVYQREQLQPLTKFRQQHRRTVDGRLCAAAFVQDRHAYTGCTDAPDPDGESGREWCYVEAQIIDADPKAAAWSYCAPVPDYDSLRASAGPMLNQKTKEVSMWVGKLQKAQRAAETTLELFRQRCDARA